MVCTVMRISVLGPPRLTVGDRQVPLPAKQAILLAILALQPHRTVSTDRLIEALWGEDAPPDLVKTLQTHVFQLRRRLEPGEEAADGAATIVTEGHGYRLEAGPKVVDASAFLALVSDARSIVDVKPEHAAALLSEALALWRGPDVAEVGGEPAATAEIERLQEVRTSAVDELVRVRLGLGETDALVADLRKAVSEAPYREQLWAGLMLALARSGQRAQALLAYRDAEAALRRELDVEPSRELQDLEARIRDEDPTLVFAPPSIAGRDRRRLRPAQFGAAVTPCRPIGCAASLRRSCARRRRHRRERRRGSRLDGRDDTSADCCSDGRRAVACADARGAHRR